MDDHSQTVAKTPGVPRYVALLLLALAIAAGSLAIFFASEAAQAAADADLLKDGVDRSRLSVEEAVGIAKLAQERSAPVPEGDDHDHDHDVDSAPARELTPEEQRVFDEQWAAATGSVHRYDTIAEVEAAGYVLASANSDGAGVHYVKWSIVDRPFEPSEPSMLLFDELVSGEEMGLIAYSYWVTSDGPPDGFVGDADSWHRHLGVCFVNGYIKGEGIPRERCPGDWVNGMDLWMLHAWVVPGVENEYGIFHNVNPLLCERACGLEN